MNDPSNGYEAIAERFISGRGSPVTRATAVGVSIVRSWAATVRPGGAVLDLGCGPGDPITRILIDAGLCAYGVDASPTMVAAFRERFPNVPVECNSVEKSNFFGRTFDGVIAWGLIFLLDADVQAGVIRKAANVLVPGGRFVFTAPRLACTWNDAMTGRRSVSLAPEEYRRILESTGLRVVDEPEDEGDNHYYMTVKS